MTLLPPVAVIGAGGHAKVVISTLRAAGRDVEGVYDDDPAKQGLRILDVPVRGAIDALAGRTLPGVIAIGDNRIRRVLARRLTLEWVSAIHPSATVHPSAEVAPGAVIFAGAIVQPDAHVGAHAILNTGATVDHDCRIEDYAHIAPGAHLAGNVTIREGAFIGIGATVIPGRTIGPWSTVGAGAAVVTDLPPHVTAVGVPAHVVKVHRHDTPLPSNPPEPSRTNRSA